MAIEAIMIDEDLDENRVGACYSVRWYKGSENSCQQPGPRRATSLSY